jgi:mono/diheme cytochrome c family protein
VIDFRFLCLFAIAFGVASSTQAQPEEKPPTAAEQVSREHAENMAKSRERFKRHVRPILMGRCIKCHGGKEAEGEFDLTTRESLLRGGLEGIAVIPGKGKESRLVRLVSHLEEPNMPEDGAKLTEVAIAHLIDWIDLGAAYDKPLAVRDEDPLAWTHRRIEDSRRDFWSFQPLSKSLPPDIESPWIRNDVDRFILARQQANKVTANPSAARRTLIRRAALDLTGLPPTPAEVSAFKADADPLAYDKLIDRLLDSPRFGERWARHWLDIARFAESHGFEQDYDRPHAYHYRDFVIKAFNQDMPFDQFVRWQLAGDEIAPTDPLAMMATGFLGAGVFPTQLTEKEFEPARYDELDDMVGTVGTAMLGLTVSCARCHDHKFDPIPARDYYRMVATFSRAIRSNVKLDLDQKGTQAALLVWQREHAPLVAKLEKFSTEELPQRFREWMVDHQQEPLKLPDWIILDLVEYQSAGGATLTRQDDGSLLATGKNPDFDKYTFTAETHLTGITAIRLEALADKSMSKGGPGRAPNGNMGLGNLIVTATPLSGDAPAKTVSLLDPRATFQQNEGNLSIAASIDSNKKSGWAVDPQFGKDHAAVFSTTEEIGFPGGTRLTFTLEFNVNNKHNIGRPRLAISTSSKPAPLDGETSPQQTIELIAAIRESGAEPSPKQQEKLLRWYRTLDPQWRALNDAVRQHSQKKPKPKLTQVMVVSEGVKPIPHHADGRGFPHFYPESFFLKRGDATQKIGPASSGFLQILMPATTAESSAPLETPWLVPPADNAKTSNRRRALANWMTDTEQGAGHLIARVIVNRLWQHHLGRGIVSTPNDFGFQGQRPTHPELLDWLARQLIDNGWHLKPIHKLIMTSAVYRETTKHSADQALVDPQNQWWWKRQSLRLEAEVIRDQMLAVSGQLDSTMFGPGTLDAKMKRRSIYFMIKRSRLVPMMQIFDSPEPLVSVGSRPRTTIAPQALLFMNNVQVRGFAAGFSKRIAESADHLLADAVTQGYLLALARQPEATEREAGVQFIERQMTSYEEQNNPRAKQLALTDFCQVLMSLNEFIFVD